MTVRKVYQVGGRLSAVHHLFSSDEQNGGIRDGFMRNMYRSLDAALATVSVESDAEEDASPSRELLESDGYFLASIMLGVLTRGPVTLLSEDAEEQILARSHGIVAVREFSPTELTTLADAARPPDFRVVALPSQRQQVRENILDVLCHLPEEVATSWSDAEDSFAEQVFRERVLRKYLGKLARLVVHQRPIRTMLDTTRPGLARYQLSRVDFALEIGSLKYVFEVDGPQHRDLAAEVDDERRDADLKNAGWKVLRLPVVNRDPGVDMFDRQSLSMLESQLDGTPALQLLASRPFSPADSSIGTLVTTPHALARIQLCVLLAMLDGTLSLDMNQWSIAVFERDANCAHLALQDLRRHLCMLASLYQIDEPPLMVLRIVDDGIGTELASEGMVAYRGRWMPDLDAFQTFDLVVDVSVHARERDHYAMERAFSGRRVFVVRTAYFRESESEVHWPNARAIAVPIERALPAYRYFFRLIYRKPDFRPYQAEAIHRAMQRKDVVALLPTGSGKSIVFQLPTFLSPGHTIIITPIRSLMNDQVDNLNRVGIARGETTHSGQSESRNREALDRIVRGNARLVYLSPERFHIESFLSEFRSSSVARNVAFVAFDEAHCVSEWGHDFRPAYLRIAHRIRDVCSNPPFLALTGTASEIVLTDMMRELSIEYDEGSVVSSDSFDRRELQFIPIEVTGRKSQMLSEAMERIRSRIDPSGSLDLPHARKVGGLVFCPNVNGAFGVDGVRQELMRAFTLRPDDVRMFSGGAPKSYDGSRSDWDREKDKTQRDFKNDLFPLIVCTKAFGMGIDKPNIRYTVHWGIPGSIEALAQEAGRAGRSREPAACVILYNKERDSIDSGFLASNIGHAEARARHQALGPRWQQDAGRIMFLHTQSYPGEEEDTAPILEMLGEIVRQQHMTLLLDSTVHVDVDRPRIGTDEAGATKVDKAVYRLSVLGVISEYTIDYGRGRFSLVTHRVDAEPMRRGLIDYVARYSAAPAEAEDEVERLIQAVGGDLTPETVVRALCRFVYERIELQRREALRNVVTMMEDAKGSSEAVSTAISNYLARSVFTARLRVLPSDLDPRAPEEWWKLAEDAKSSDLAMRLLGATSRFLESDPTHVGYRVLASMMLLTRDSPDYARIAGNLAEAIGNVSGLELEERRGRRVAIASATLDRIATQHPAKIQDLIRELTRRDDADDLLRAAHPYAVDPDLRKLCAMPWIREFSDLSSRLIADALGAAV